MKLVRVACATALLLAGYQSAIACGAGVLPQAAPQRPAARAKVDVNTATQEQLEQVPGIGPALARRILEWRRQNGPFETLEELLHVRGIGPRTLDRLRPYLEVRTAKDAGGGRADGR